jgi:thiamine biosynthesis lipoprotein
MFKKIGILILVAFMLSGCSRVMELKRQGFYLDNVVEVKVKYKKDKELKERTENALANAFNSLVQLDTNLNRFSTISELVALNTMAGLRNVEVSPETYSLIKKSIAASIITDGYFDVSWAPLTKIFENGRQPTQAEIRMAQAASGYLNIQLDRGLNRVKFSNSMTNLNFDRIKRGYAIDSVAQNLINAILPVLCESREFSLYLGVKKKK